ncbi:MAG: phosphoribosyltransferase family protein [Candidatus Taylorbacteria bacterium]
MQDIISILKKVGAILPNGHFVGTSGRHMDTYITKDALFPHTQVVSMIGKMFAEKYRDTDVEVVVGPAIGGIILSQWVAFHLSELKKKEVLSVYTEKTADNNQVFNRGYGSLVKGKKILVIEDTVTTGGSVKKSIESAKRDGGDVIGVCVMVNKDPDQINEVALGAPFSALGELEVKTYEAKDCPLCKAGVPINTTFGHGKKFLELRTFHK